MLRSFLISLSKAAWAQRMFVHWKLAKRMASRFIAGETLTEALEVVGQLNSRGLLATVDHLGENTTTEEEAVKAADEIIEILQALSTNALKSNISVKLSQIGLTINENLCRENLRRLLDTAKTEKNFVRIDMEDSSLTEKTIGMYLWARQAGYSNVGIVVQAYLYRSEKDIIAMGEFDTRVRLCKGAYKEPTTVAFPKKEEVNTSFDRLVVLLLESARNHGLPELSKDGRIPPIPGVATHDVARIEYAKRKVAEMGVAKNVLEFQMLHGIRRDLQDSLSREGYPVRVYVPFGTRWYPYFMRRLAERPANLWFFISNYFKR